MAARETADVSPAEIVAAIHRAWAVAEPWSVAQVVYDLEREPLTTASIAAAIVWWSKGATEAMAALSEWLSREGDGEVSDLKTFSDEVREEIGAMLRAAVDAHAHVGRELHRVHDLLRASKGGA